MLHSVVVLASVFIFLRKDQPHLNKFHFNFKSKAKRYFLGLNLLILKFCEIHIQFWYHEEELEKLTSWPSYVTAKQASQESKKLTE